MLTAILILCVVILAVALAGLKGLVLMGFELRAISLKLYHMMDDGEDHPMTEDELTMTEDELAEKIEDEYEEEDAPPLREIEISNQPYTALGLLAKCDLTDSYDEASLLIVSGQVAFEGVVVTAPTRRVPVSDGMVVHVQGLSPVKIKLMPLEDVPPTRPGNIPKPA